MLRAHGEAEKKQNHILPAWPRVFFLFPGRSILSGSMIELLCVFTFDLTAAFPHRHHREASITSALHSQTNKEPNSLLNTCNQSLHSTVKAYCGSVDGHALSPNEATIETGPVHAGAYGG